MKVLLISRGYPSDKYPTHGIFEFDQAKAIANLGHKVILASIDMRSIRRKRKWGFEKFEKDGVLIYGVNFPIGRGPNFILNFFSTIALRILYRRIEKEQGKPDIMHAHFTRIGYVAAKLKEDVDIPLVITEHSSEMMKQPINNSLKRIANYAYHKADRVIAVSPALSKVIESNFKIDAIYVPNIVDTSNFQYKEKNTRDFTFITVGNLIYRKRMDLTVEAFSKAFENVDNVKLMVIGEGEERKKLEDIIKRDKLDKKVVLKGRLDRNAISKYMNQSDCFVLASRAETFGVVYIEAMASGLPVIATKCGGPEGFVNEENGILIPVDDMDALVDAMKWMYENIKIYNKEYISKSIIEKFSYKIVSEKIVEIYKDIIVTQRKAHA